MGAKQSETEKFIKSIKLQQELTKDSYTDEFLVGSFTIFTTIDNRTLLVYATKENTIIFMNFEDFQKIHEIHNTIHSEQVTTFRHHLDKTSNPHRDLLLTISSKGNDAVIWDIKDYSCVILIQLEFNKEYDIYFYSGCFLGSHNIPYIVAGFHSKAFVPQPICIFNMEGQSVKQIQNTNAKIFYIDNYYDKNISKNYIIICMEQLVVSYNFEDDKVYNVYPNEFKTFKHLKIYHNNHCLINDNGPIVKLIISSYDNYIKVWDFNAAKVLVKIKCKNAGIMGMCLWDNDYLFACGDDTMIKLVNYTKGKVVKTLPGHKYSSLTVKKAHHPKFGDCIVSIGTGEDQIRLWTFNANQV